MRLLFFIVFSFISLFSFAQTYTGKVVDEGERPLMGVSVILLGNGNRNTLCFTRTSHDGFFSISENQNKKASGIMFSCVGYARDTVSVKDYRQGRVFVLREKAIEIREVKVNAPRIIQHGDTLNFLVKSFRQKQDRSIADVIRKMPGLQVDNSGTITYQGKQINKFYIEGLDLMGTKYTQASENISADKVKTVQVLENHQPIRMLRDVDFSDQAALNIVLTDDAKSVWQGTADIGEGATMQGNIDILGDERLTGMMFSKKMQSISMYKYNNTGKDVMKEVTGKHVFEDKAPTEENILEGITVATPAIESSHTTFNDTHILATNWLFKTKRGDDSRIQVNGLLDNTELGQSTQTVYTDVNDGTAILEDVNADNHTCELSTEMKYSINRDDIFLTNTLNGFACFNKSTSQTILDGNNILEKVKPRKLYVSDYFSLDKRFDNFRIFSLNAYFSYNNLPGRLLLSDNTTQKLDMQSLYWGAETYFGHRIADINIRYTLSTRGKSQNLSIHNNDFNGKDCYDEIETRIVPQAIYKKNGFKFNASVPFVWLARSLNGSKRNDLLFEPRISLSFEPTAHWGFSASYAYSCNPLDLRTSGSLPIFTSYITMKLGNSRLNDTRTNMLSSYINYKNTIKGQFASVGITWSKLSGNVLYSSEIDNNIYKSYATDRISCSHSFTAFTRLAQSFRWSKLNIGISAYYIGNDYDLLISNTVRPCRMNNLVISADISLQPMHWLSFEGYSGYSMSKQEYKDGQSPIVPTLNTFNHGFKVFLMPGHWQFEWDNEIYHSNDESVSFNYFSDVSVSYRRKDYEIGLAMDNVFGNTVYQRHTINAFYHRYQATTLRARAILAKLSFNF